MLDITEKSNNGTSWLDKVLGYPQMLFHVLMENVTQIQNQKPVLSFMKNVIIKEEAREFAKTLHSLILIMKSNLLRSQIIRPFIFITYLVSMERMLISVNLLNV